MIEDGTYVPQTAPAKKAVPAPAPKAPALAKNTAVKAAEPVWGEWYKTDQKDWKGWAEAAPGSSNDLWREYLPMLGFKGNVGRFEGNEDSASFVYTPEAQAAINKLKLSGYDIMYRPGTHNVYHAIKTPQGGWRLNKEGGSLLKDFVLPAASMLAGPLSGGLSAALGGGTATLGSTIAANALIQGGIGALSGKDPLKSALTGGLTAGIGSLAAPIASSIGSNVLKATESPLLADIASGAIKAGAGALPAGLISGDLSNVLSSALTGGVTSGVTSGLSDITGLAPKDINNAIKAVQNLDNPLALANIASSYLPGPTMPGAGTTEDIQEGFFEPGGPGFMPTEYLDDEEVQRELTSLLGRYPTPAAPSEWFLGENVPSGVPEWDMAAVNAGLPIGNLEQDFYVEQAKEGPRIVDSAGNVGTFVNGEFVVDTGVTPDLSYLGSITPPAPASAPTPAPTPKPPTPTPAPSPLAQFAKSLGIPQEMAAQMLQESSEADLLTMFAELSEEREKKRKERGIADLLKSRKA